MNGGDAGGKMRFTADMFSSGKSGVRLQPEAAAFRFFAEAESLRYKSPCAVGLVNKETNDYNT